MDSVFSTWPNVEARVSARGQAMASASSAPPAAAAAAAAAAAVAAAGGVDGSTGVATQPRFEKPGLESDERTTMVVAGPGHGDAGTSGLAGSVWGSPCSPPQSPGPVSSSHAVSKIGQYLLLGPVAGERVFRAVHVHTGEEFVCKVYELSRWQENLGAQLRLSAHPHVCALLEVVLGERSAYALHERAHGDMHAHVRAARRLAEPEAARLFRQIAGAVAHCHGAGVVLRDLKLRKFVFADADRTTLKLESLEDAYVLPDDDVDDDSLSNKHGCPAYVSPEILSAGCAGTYSGRAADVWSLGVMLYTMLVGRYPFHDAEPAALFQKIRRGQFSVPDWVSPRARCLIRSLLRREPSERLQAAEILEHPWFRMDGCGFTSRPCGSREREHNDQVVPDVDMAESEDPFFS
uniref:Tribbles homolog 2-like n=1 Tax=Petromyzon marinus TaxID=7757 RepID=A0AAJ7T231_PETMA|nr:tribbles homolog 2-like [Petromyzon marinus]